MIGLMSLKSMMMGGMSLMVSMMMLMSKFGKGGGGGPWKGGGGGGGGGKIAVFMFCLIVVSNCVKEGPKMAKIGLKWTPLIPMQLSF